MISDNKLVPIAFTATIENLYNFPSIKSEEFIIPVVVHYFTGPDREFKSCVILEPRPLSQ